MPFDLQYVVKKIKLTASSAKERLAAEQEVGRGEREGKGMREEGRRSEEKEGGRY